MNDLSVRNFLKHIVADLKAANNEKRMKILEFASSRSASWFDPKKGKYVYLTDIYIDTAPFARIEEDLILLIADCFKHR